MKVQLTESIVKGMTKMERLDSFIFLKNLA